MPSRCALACAFVALFAACAAAATSESADAIQKLRVAAPLPKDCQRVPEDFATIQAAIDAAPDGGTVLVAPGVYHESLTITGKSVCLASWFLVDHDPQHILRTVLDGTLPDPDIEDDVDVFVDQVIEVDDDADPATTILGFTIRDGDDGVSGHAPCRILFNRFVANVDAIDYEGGGGECRFNTFIANDDDAVDFDEHSAGLVANNEMRDNDDDGIEIRLHPYRGDALRVVIRDNVITGNGENGIQIIDYPALSDRAITIERNYIAFNAMAGIGCMADANSREDYQGAPIPEPIAIVNNTLVGNHYGITGGANAHVINNVIARHHRAGLKNVAGRSVLTHNLLWQNGAKPAGCNLADGVVMEVDPRLDAKGRPLAGSPCLDAGAMHIELDGAETIAPASFRGAAPDLGAYEIE